MLLFLKNLLFTIVVPGTVAVYVPLFAFAHDLPRLSLTVLAGGMLLTMGGAVYLWCVWDFATAGRGTPAPIDPPKNLVVRGLYKHTRNPMYVGIVGLIFGWAASFSSTQIAIYGLVVGVLFHLRVVLFEEPHLTREFGPSYEDYCAHVSRWLP
tara:strand:+ start:191 stop:649 length:459 start_codon:yes stop_codon:yes gene_type:complete